MAELKLTPAQNQKLRDNPLHYQCSIRYVESENVFVCECDSATAMKIKKIIDT